MAADDAIVPLGKLGSVSGVVYNDLNQDGIQDPGELGLKNRTVFLDTNHNGMLDEGELFAKTKADGSYTIKKVPAGDYDIIGVAPKGWHPTNPFVEGAFYEAEAARFKFIEISNHGEMVFGNTDDGYAFLEATNGFTFYGQSHIDINISVNGFLSFVSNPEELGYLNQELADPTGPNNVLAPLWDDFVLGDNGKVYAWDDYQNGRIIIEWKDVTHFGDTSGNTSTFEAILYDDGSIKFMYKEIAPSLTATVGVENEDGTVATQISYNTDVAAGTGYLLTPTDILFGRTTIHVDPGAVVTGIDFAQAKNVHAPVLHGFDVAQHAPMIAHDLALA